MTPDWFVLVVEWRSEWIAVVWIGGFGTCRYRALGPTGILVRGPSWATKRVGATERFAETTLVLSSSVGQDKLGSICTTPLLGLRFMEANCLAWLLVTSRCDCAFGGGYACAGA